MLQVNKIYNMEAIEFMKQIDESVVDLVLCDLPYEVTQNDWDKKLKLKNFFQECWRVLKEDGTIVLTSQQPFTTALINAEPKYFKYELIWDKIRTSGFLNANRMPLRSHENILVFYKKLGTYNPQFTQGEKSHSKGKMKTDVNNNYGDYGKIDNTEVHGNKKFPKSILAFIKPHPPIHPTQKPVELFEWLVKTYSNEGDLVLVRLHPYISYRALDGNYQIVDYLPSGLKPVTQIYNRARYFGKCDILYYPTMIEGNTVYFKIWKGFERSLIFCKNKTVNYYARVVSKGKFRTNPAIIQSLKDLKSLNVSPEDWIEIK